MGVPSSSHMQREIGEMRLCALGTSWTPAIPMGTEPWPQACGKSHQSCLRPWQSCQRLLVLPATVQACVGTGQLEGAGQELALGSFPMPSAPLP